jgi:hypothetical protein
MLEDCSHVNQVYNGQKMSKTEETNWITMDDIKNKYNEYLTEVIPMLNHKTPINDRVIIDCLLIGCMSGVAGVAPRRSLDYSLMKIKNFDREKDNYYEKDKFVFNVYKTAKTYGKTVVDVKAMAPDLNNLIKKWIKINKQNTSYILLSVSL